MIKKKYIKKEIKEIKEEVEEAYTTFKIERSKITLWKRFYMFFWVDYAFMCLQENEFDNWLLETRNNLWDRKVDMEVRRLIFKK